MNIGVIGLGKVGLPLALVLRHYGRHNVIGYDKDSHAVDLRQWDDANNPRVHPERLTRELLAAGPIAQAPTIGILLEHVDVVIVVVDTPHPPGLDTTAASSPDGGSDFDYTNLRAAIDEVIGAVDQHKQLTLIITSTVSPGTTHSLTTKCPGNIKVGYSPVLISLGSVALDLITPDMVLAGADHPDVWETIAQIWTPVVNTVPIAKASITGVEIAKLTLNAYLSFKIAFANSVAQLASFYDADADHITGIIAKSKAVTSDRYLRAGLADSGACRPRDTLVLEYISTARVDTGLWRALTEHRHEHTWWLADEIRLIALDADLSVTICGTAYKGRVPYTDGSIGLMLAGQLLSLGVDTDLWDPVVEPDSITPPYLGLFVLTTDHNAILEWLATKPAPGSIIFDPMGVALDPPEGVRLVRPGRKR